AWTGSAAWTHNRPRWRSCPRAFLPRPARPGGPGGGRWPCRRAGGNGRESGRQRRGAMSEGMVPFPPPARMKTPASRTVRLEIASRLDLLEVVHTVLTHLGGLLGFDDEAMHYMTVAVRESVVNAIKHGNKGDENKRVGVEFVLHTGALEFRVQDEGTGFDP